MCFKYLFLNSLLKHTMNLSSCDPTTSSVDNLVSSDRVEEILEDEVPSAVASENVGVEEKIEEPSAVEEPLAAEFEEPEVPKCLANASLSKEEGNKFYRDGEYDLALHSYTNAIDYCPIDNAAELVGLMCSLLLLVPL